MESLSTFTIRLDSRAEATHLAETLVSTNREGMDWIHFFKFPSPDLVNERIRTSVEAGVGSRILDIGSLPRVTEDESNPDIKFLPNKDLCVEVSLNDRIFLIPRDTPEEIALRIRDSLPPNVILLKVSRVPIFDDGSRTPEEISFGDNDIICSDIELLEILGVQLLSLSVIEINNQGYLYANHKITSRTNPLTELHTPSELDIEALESIDPENRPFVEFVALSFATSEGITELKKILYDLGFINAQVIAKIESEQGLSDLEEIALLTAHIMIALGDLEFVCLRKEWNFRETVRNISKRLESYDIILYAASGLADSLIDGENQELTEDEMLFLQELYSRGVRVFGLTKETWVTFDPEAPERTYALVNIFLQAILQIRNEHVEETIE